MLKKGIIESMLSDSPNFGKWRRWKSIFYGVYNFILEILKMLTFFPEKEEKKLGDKFYDHPLLKNYGSIQIFPHPSCIPSDNFSFVLLDILKDDFLNKVSDIAYYRFLIILFR